ncbi:MAG: hypothetical protein ABH886_00430 [Candidatus Desantisbacteria bacterium]
MAEEKEEGLMLDKKTMDVLITNIIPTSKYFEVRFDHLQQQMDLKFGYLQQQINVKFDHLQQQVDDVKSGVKSLEDKMDKRFEQVDKRFEQVDKRFDKIDKRFEQIDVKLDKLIERVDVKIDAGLRENRALTTRLFTFAMTFAAISMAGLIGKMLEIF